MDDTSPAKRRRRFSDALAVSPAPPAALDDDARAPAPLGLGWSEHSSSTSLQLTALLVGPQALPPPRTRPAARPRSPSSDSESSAPVAPSGGPETTSDTSLPSQYESCLHTHRERLRREAALLKNWNYLLKKDSGQLPPPPPPAPAPTQSHRRRRPPPLQASSAPPSATPAPLPRERLSPLLSLLPPSFERGRHFLLLWNVFLNSEIPSSPSDSASFLSSIAEDTRSQILSFGPVSSLVALPVPPPLSPPSACAGSGLVAVSFLNDETGGTCAKCAGAVAGRFVEGRAVFAEVAIAQIDDEKKGEADAAEEGLDDFFNSLL